MVFSEATNKTGMYEWFQDLCGVNPTSYTAYKYARDANNALADYLLLGLKHSGKWKVDDSNQSTYAEISRNIVSGTYFYSMTVDDETNANQIIEIDRVECASESTANASLFQPLISYDPMDDNQEYSITAQRNITGVPYRYYKKDNGIFIDPKPNFSATGGLKVFVSRTTTYFAGTDTTKVAGIPHSHQKYLVLKPALEYCMVNVPARANGILTLLQLAEQEIKDYFVLRDKSSHVMRGKKIFYI